MNELSERERARIAGFPALHKRCFTGTVHEQFFRDLYALGLIDGWRAIQRIDLKEKQHEPAAANV